MESASCTYGWREDVKHVLEFCPERGGTRRGAAITAGKRTRSRLICSICIMYIFKSFNEFSNMCCFNKGPMVEKRVKNHLSNLLMIMEEKVAFEPSTPLSLRGCRTVKAFASASGFSGIFSSSNHSRSPQKGNQLLEGVILDCRRPDIC